MDTQIEPVKAVAPKLPAKVVAKRMREAQEKPADGKPKGWWALPNLSGTLDGVTKAVDASAIPDRWKAAIKADLALRCVDGFNFVYLDAHFHLEKGNAVLHYHAQADKKLI